MHQEFLQVILVDEKDSTCIKIHTMLTSKLYRFKSIPKPKKEENNEGLPPKKRKQDDSSTESESDQSQEDSSTESEFDQSQEDVMTIIKITDCVIINEHDEIIPKSEISFSLVDDNNDELFDANICRALNDVARKYVDMDACEEKENSIKNIIRFMRTNNAFMTSEREPDSPLYSTLMKYAGMPKLLMSEVLLMAPIANNIRIDSAHIVERLCVNDCVQTESGVTTMILKKAE